MICNLSRGTGAQCLVLVFPTVRGFAVLDNKYPETPLPSACDPSRNPAGSGAAARRDGTAVTANAKAAAYFRRAFKPDALGDTFAYRAQWGSRFDFMFRFANDRKRWV